MRADFVKVPFKDHPPRHVKMIPRGLVGKDLKIDSVWWTLDREQGIYVRKES